MLLRHATTLSAEDFWPAFLVVAAITALSSIIFYQLPPDAGHEISGRKAAEISSRKGATKGVEKKASEGTADARDHKL